MTVEQPGAPMAIGWIGVGKMGMPMCENLVKAGHDVAAYDVVPQVLEAIAGKGAKPCASVAQLVGHADVVFTMVPSDAVLLSLVDGPEGLGRLMRPEQTLVDMSTVSPSASAGVAARLQASGCGYLRAPVSGSTANAAAATLSIFCSGPAERFDAVKDVLGKLGSKLTYCGTAEQARVLKLLVNIIVGVTPALVGEALAFGEQSGIDRTMILDAIGASAGASPVIGYKLDMLKRKDWTAMATIDTVAKDLDLALQWGRARGVSMPFTALAQQTNTAYQASGHGQLDFFAVADWPARLLARDTQ